MLRRIGNLVIANGNVKFSYTGGFNYSLAQERIPAGFRPLEQNVVLACTNVFFSMLPKPSGEIDLLGNPQSKYSPLHGVWLTNDTLPTA